jgi:hypothetical protein
VLSKIRANKPQMTKYKEIVKFMTEINERDQKVSETESWSFEKKNNIDKPLAKQTKRRWDRNKLIKFMIKR